MIHSDIVSITGWLTLDKASIGRQQQDVRPSHTAISTRVKPKIHDCNVRPEVNSVQWFADTVAGSDREWEY
ncbi:MAG TPA: hypothetical protein VF595_17105, partial [Tepidisphaeraceae bacterium]